MKPNWPAMIATLREHGWSRWKIANLLGIRTNQLDLIINGSEPKYTVGLTLIALHGSVLAEVPCETTNSCTNANLG